MKDKKSVGVSTSTPVTALNLHGLSAALIRKNRPEDLILRRLREYLLYSKLESLIPPRPFELGRPEDESEGATEVKLEPHESLERDSDDENGNATPITRGGTAIHVSDKEEEEEEEEEEKDHEDEKKCCTVEFESDEEGEEGSQPFVPSIKIKRMDDLVMISTVVLKDVALTSALFRVLEEEKLDIVYENQYRTETRVAHSIQVRVVQPEFNIDGLEKKLCTWAGKPT